MNTSLFIGLILALSAVAVGIGVLALTHHVKLSHYQFSGHLNEVILEA